MDELAEHEKDNTSEDFIKSEIAKEIDSIKAAHASLEKQIDKQKKSTEKILEKEKSEKEKSEKEKQTQIDQLLRKIKEKESLEEHLQKLNEEQAKFSEEQIIETKKTILEEINRTIITIENTQKPLKEIINREYKNYKWRLSIIPVLYFFIISFLIYKLTWNVIEPYTYLSSLLGLICSYLYFAISGESFSPLKHFNNKKAKITKRVYSELKFDFEYLEEQRERKTKLESEIDELLSTTSNILKQT
ncbi:MAG: hypothetical protein H8D45_33140 [Bacteroidetes bacterium]|nr:hypothetical protein [Bacteroidota bacterium]